MATEIRVASNLPAARESLRELIMAWARDSATGQPVYIMELGDDRRGAKSGCVCPNCRAPLTAVNAAKTVFIKRPHFRHQNGNDNQSCAIVAARAAILKEMHATGWIQLPKVQRKATAIGLSGQEYEVWVSRPAVRVKIDQISFQDHARALLTLKDGRQIVVPLLGTASLTPTDELRACLTLEIDDPEAAALTPEELRNRLTLLPDFPNAMCWQSHWDDQELDAEAQAQLAQEMLDALDAPPPDLDLSSIPPELRRETVLHYMAKELLKEAGMIRVPAITITATRNPKSWKTFTRSWHKTESTLSLSNIELECRLGRVIPDIGCQATDEQGELIEKLFIEITVTNPIDEERKARLKATGHHTLELNLSLTGGRLTLESFKQMLVQEVEFKKWIYHPESDAAMSELDRLVNNDVRQYLARRKAEDDRLENERRFEEEAKSEDANYLGQQYIAAQIELLQKERGIGLSEADMKPIELLEKKLQAHGYVFESGLSGTSTRWMVQALVSIQRGIYNPIANESVSGFDVLAARWHGGSMSRQHFPLYLAAAKIWNIPKTPKQAALMAQWSNTVKRSITNGEKTYLRNPVNDRLLKLLFPDLNDARPNAFDNTTGQYMLKRLCPTTTQGPIHNQLPLLPQKQLEPGNPADGLAMKQGGFLRGSELEKWLRDNPEHAPMWKHLRR